MLQLLLLLLCCIFSGGIVYYSIPAIIRVAKAKHLFDQPNERNVTTQVVPTLGGVAIFLGMSISTTLFSFQETFQELPYILVAAILMLFVGLKDDLMDLAPHKKLIAQIGVAVIIAVFADIRFTHLHGLFGIGEINYVASVAITVFTFIVMINAINLIDGIDGLASGVAIVAASAFGIWFYSNDHMSLALLAFATVGALVSFFIFNVFGKKHKIFMGDTGSLLLGFILAILVIQFNELSIHTVASRAFVNAPILSYAIMIVPLTDTLRVFMIRILRKQSPFKADRIHTHHDLLLLGFTHFQTSLILVASNIIFIGIAIGVQNFNSYFVLLGIIVLAMGLACVPHCILKLRGDEEHLKSFIFEAITSKEKATLKTVKSSPNGIQHKSEDSKEELGLVK